MRLIKYRRYVRGNPAENSRLAGVYGQTRGNAMRDKYPIMLIGAKCKSARNARRTM